MLLRDCFCVYWYGQRVVALPFFACTSGRGNLLLRYTIMEGITCCRILFMNSKLEF